MNRSMIRAAWVLIAIAGVLSACSFSLGYDGADAQTVRDDLAARLTEAQQAQTQALALWDRLIAGEMVSCEDAIPRQNWWRCPRLNWASMRRRRPCRSCSIPQSAILSLIHI